MNIKWTILLIYSVIIKLLYYGYSNLIKYLKLYHIKFNFDKRNDFNFRNSSRLYTRDNIFIYKDLYLKTKFIKKIDNNNEIYDKNIDWNFKNKNN